MTRKRRSWREKCERRRRLRRLRAERYRLVTIESTWFPMDAQIVRNRLQFSGIPAFLEGDMFVTWFWTRANAVGGVKVQVAARDAARAVALLESFRSAPANANQALIDAAGDVTEPSAAETEEVCTECGSSNTTVEHYSRHAAFLTSLFLPGFPVPIRRYKRRCFDCHARVPIPTPARSTSEWLTLFALAATVVAIVSLAVAFRMAGKDAIDPYQYY